MVGAGSEFSEGAKMKQIKLKRKKNYVRTLFQTEWIRFGNSRVFFSWTLNEKLCACTDMCKCECVVIENIWDGGI